MKGDLYRAQRVLQLNHHEKEEKEGEEGGQRTFHWDPGDLAESHWPSEGYTIITKEFFHPLSHPSPSVLLCYFFMLKL